MRNLLNNSMSLTYQEKLTLANGSVVLYHEGTLQTGDNFHVLIVVPGRNVEKYFKLIATKEDFPVSELEDYGRILHCDIGGMSDASINSCIQNITR